ncbi:alkylation response protein AidB-like acyl-CoA dehydrogenase [Bradyrhizobium elkanii]|nr:alkylation response protein AidB-like acyl-CoA dehydrogenase [Bradyrhizobium elkanii]MCW2373564.1 alkylation response protein AidB-like acyl-CoA dehydrogenase [Bradyrhizobium elkanii]
MAAIEASNDDVAGMLRDSLRGFLDEHWLPLGLTASSSPDEVSAIWRKLVGQGVAALGARSCEGGLAEILVVMAELGRAGCAAPMWSAALANLAISGSQVDVAVDLLERLHSGEATVAFSFGALDPDAGTGAVEVTDLKAKGVLRFVEAAGGATHLLVVLDQAQLGLINLDGPGVECVATRAMGAWGLYEVRLNEAPLTCIPIDAVDVDHLRIKGRAMLTARAHGAARRAFELAVDYAKERHQFGQPIGRFQAIQHKLADCLIALEGVRLILDHAARLHDGGEGGWRYFADCASAFSGHALRQVSLEVQHTFGAIGYAEEHEAPIHFKRVHLDTIALGGASDAKSRLAARLLDAGGVGLPQYDLGAAGNAFREQIRLWLEQNWTGDAKLAFDGRPFAKREFDAPFARDIGGTGWIGLGWPEQFGGQARSPLEQIAFMETMERGEAPRIGAAIQANALMMFGTAAQQQKYLPEILRGEAMHGMGYSEPQAGSDLAALRHQCGQGRRSLGDQRPEDLDHHLVGEIHVPRRADRQGREAAARGHQHVYRADGCAGHHHPSVCDHVRWHVCQHLLRQRPHPVREPRWRGQWRLESVDRRAGLRAWAGWWRDRPEGRACLRAAAFACDGEARRSVSR